MSTIHYKKELARNLFKKSCKLFPNEMYFYKNWINFECNKNVFNFKNAREVLEKSIKLLSNKKQHIDLLLTLAKNELNSTYSNNSNEEYRQIFEHGKTIMEKILNLHSKDYKIWKIYISAVKKTKDTSMIRSLYERATNQKMSKSVISKLLKEWMKFEVSQGNQDMISVVRYRCAEIGLETGEDAEEEVEHEEQEDNQQLGEEQVDDDENDDEMSD